MKTPSFSFITDWLTEKDGVSYCPVRIAFLSAVVYYFYGTAHDITNFLDHAKDWASGMRDLLTGGLAVAAKAFTEKEAPPHE